MLEKQSPIEKVLTDKLIKKWNSKFDVMQSHLNICFLKFFIILYCLNYLPRSKALNLTKQNKFIEEELVLLHILV